MEALVFDVDNTLTPPRRPLEPEMAQALQRLRLPFHLAAGSDLPLVEQQLIEPLHRAGFRGAIDAFVCNGAQRFRCRFGATVEVSEIESFCLRTHLGDAGFARLMSVLHTTLASPEFGLAGSPLVIPGPRLVDRGSMINLAPTGRPERMDAAAFAAREAFVRFDRETGYRERLRLHLEQALADLRATRQLRINLGGQTSFDIVVRGYDKRFPIHTLLREGATHVTYFGDALHEGGNDAAVLELIAEWEADTPAPVRAVSVGSWRDTLEHLERSSLLSS